MVMVETQIMLFWSKVVVVVVKSKENIENSSSVFYLRGLNYHDHFV